MNYFEIECGGCQADSGLYYRAGVNSCFYQMSHISKDSIQNIFWLPEVDEDTALKNENTLNTKVNFVTVSTHKRDCPKAVGCE